MKASLAFVLGVVITTFWFSAAISATRCTDIAGVFVSNNGSVEVEVKESLLYKQINMYAWVGTVRNIWRWEILGE